MNLYLVRCRGMQSALGGPGFGVAYVVAEDPTSAYNKLRADLDKRDLGFGSEREMESITLLAQVAEYPSTAILYL